MSAMTFRSRILIVSLTIIFLVGTGILWFWLGESKEADFSDFTQKYSSGWYNYTFNYPSSGEVIPTPPFLGGISDDLVIIKEGDKGCALFVVFSREKTAAGNYKAKDEDQVIFNDIRWEKTYAKTDYRLSDYAQQSEGKFYGKDLAFHWQTRKEEFTYAFDAPEGSERFCERIISSFTFSTDDSDPNVIEAKKAKEAALQYVSENYSGKIYARGSFTAGPQDRFDSEGKAMRTNAVIEFADSVETSLPVRMGVRVEKGDNGWSVPASYLQ